LKGIEKVEESATEEVVKKLIKIGEKKWRIVGGVYKWRRKKKIGEDQGMSGE